MDDRRDLRKHIIHVFKHGAFRRSEITRALNVSHYLLILVRDLVKKLADHLQFSLGIFDHAGNFHLHGCRTVRGIRNAVK